MSQELINVAIAVFGAGIGWFLKVVWESIKMLQEEIRDMEKELHTKYVAKEDYKQDIVEMKEILKQIFDKLDKKADK